MNYDSHRDTVNIVQVPKKVFSSPIEVAVIPMTTVRIKEENFVEHLHKIAKNKIKNKGKNNKQLKIFTTRTRKCYGSNPQPFLYDRSLVALYCGSAVTNLEGQGKPDVSRI